MGLIFADKCLVAKFLWLIIVFVSEKSPARKSPKSNALPFFFILIAACAREKAEPDGMVNMGGTGGTDAADRLANTGGTEGTNASDGITRSDASSCFRPLKELGCASRWEEQWQVVSPAACSTCGLNIKSPKLSTCGLLTQWSLAGNHGSLSCLYDEQGDLLAAISCTDYSVCSDKGFGLCLFSGPDFPSYEIFRDLLE